MGRIDRTAVAFGILFLTVLNTACASAPRDGGRRYEHPERGYSLPDPNQLEGATQKNWRKLRVADADFAFRGPNDVFMAISSHCDEAEVEPAALARQLLVGLSNRTRVEHESFVFADGNAFLQSVEATQDDSVIRAKTVTWVRGGCVVDWVLVTSGSLFDAEQTFDAWWRGFDPGSMSTLTDGLAEAGR